MVYESTKPISCFDNANDNVTGG